MRSGRKSVVGGWARQRSYFGGLSERMHAPLRLRMSCAALIAAGIVTPQAFAAPEGGVVKAGAAQIVQSGKRTEINQTSARAAIDWRSFSIGADERVNFNQPSASSSTLNRVTGEQASVILGRMTANGQVILVNPNGTVFGKDSRVDVGGLVASTANISNVNFMAGKLSFDEPGKPGAGILQSGTITAAEGGLVALVAPHVRNDGLIQARLGKVVLGSADTFTIDLFGDQLISLALDEQQARQLLDADGQPVTSLIRQTGTIDVAGGTAVLVTASSAKAVLDNVINMSGTIKADSVQSENGRILLLGRGGGVDVSGELQARGDKGHGGTIEVFGDELNLAATATVDATGAGGGGTLRIGGDADGAGAYRAQHTMVAKGARLDASAGSNGDGGKVIVTADTGTAFHGAAFARGGKQQGDGGGVAISGAQTLVFDGLVDASAPRGNAGSLTLRATDIAIGDGEAASISNTLRTRTNTIVSADGVARVNSTIDGRLDTSGKQTSGDLTIEAGKAIGINNDIFTDNGAVTLSAAAGKVSMAKQKTPIGAESDRTTPLIYSGAAPIAIKAGGDVSAYELITSGNLSIRSQGSVILNAQLGEFVPLEALIVEARGTGSPIAGSIRMTDARVRDGGSITLLANGNIGIEKVNLQDDSSGFARAENARPGGVTIESALLGDLWSNPFFRSHAELAYINPGADGDWRTLSDNGAKVPSPGLIPPGPTRNLPSLQWLENGVAAVAPSPIPVAPPAPAAGITAEPPPAAASTPPALTVQASAESPRGTVASNGGDNSERADSLVNSVVTIVDRTATGTGNGAIDLALGPTDIVSGGRGIARLADLGRDGAASAPSDVFSDKSHVVEGPACEASAGGTATGYFGRDSFGYPFSVSCK